MSAKPNSKEKTEKVDKCCKTCGRTSYQNVPGTDTRYICCSDRNRGIMGIESASNVNQIGSRCKDWRVKK